MGEGDGFPGPEVAACRLLSLEKFLWRLCTTRAMAREGRWEEARRHHREAYCLFDELHWYGPVTSWTRFEVSPELDGVGTSIYNRDVEWVGRYVEEVLRLVREYVNPEFAR